MTAMIMNVLEHIKIKIIRNCYKIALDLGWSLKPYRRNKAMLIDKGDWELSFFNADFLNDITSLMLYALARGYVPYIKLKDREPGYIDYDTFFQQPYMATNEAVVVKCNKTFGYYDYGYYVAFNSKELRRWCFIYDKLVKLNSATQQYIDAEYNSLIHPSFNVLGVVCRGTDFLTDPNPVLPVQPRVEDILEEAVALLRTEKYSHIYLATECESVYKLFQERFPNQLIVNKRTYYDDVMKRHNIGRITNVHFERDNDNYYKSLEYLSSLVILSRCKALIGGCCGATMTALFFNNLSYEYTHIYNLGNKGSNGKPYKER